MLKLLKFGNPWFLILCDDPRLFCDGCSWVPCLVWTVKLSTVLQKYPAFFSFPASFAYLNPLVSVWFWNLFTLRTIDGFKHNYQKRLKYSLMPEEIRCIKSQGVKTFAFEDQCKLYLNLSSGKHASIFCCLTLLILVLILNLEISLNKCKRNRLSENTDTSRKIWISWKRSIYFVTHFRKWNPYL